jgi:pyruvate dehydrogenase E2 component (dihydrolipoyllysine-residue acetyltransferase)
MPSDVIMPALGMAQETGKVIQWLKSEGQAVVKGEPLLEIETDKVTVELESPASGTLAGISAVEGDDVPVGTAIAVVLAEGETFEAAVTTPPIATAPEPNRTTAPDLQRPGARRLASPKARRVAAELGVDLDAFDGSGPSGAVVAGDLEHAARESDGPSAVWKLMAERATQSWQSVPHFYLRREVDASGLQSWREAARNEPGGASVSHTDLLIKLVAEALRRHPMVNATWSSGTVRRTESINVGIAVATDDGLVVPVVHDADRLQLASITERRTEIVRRARAGRLQPKDVTGGTFTISNLGMYGVDSFDAIVNAPQAAILAVGRIVDRIVPLDGLPAVRPRLQLSVSCDHRVVDGARGAEFLDTLASLVEDPAALAG